MKTTEEKQQHNEIKLINESNGMDEKNCPKGVQKTLASSHKDTNSQETVKNVNAQFLFLCFKL